MSKESVAAMVHQAIVGGELDGLWGGYIQRQAAKLELAERLADAVEKEIELRPDSPTHTKRGGFKSKQYEAEYRAAVGEKYAALNAYREAGK